jgi:hypothetical protein
MSAAFDIYYSLINFRNQLVYLLEEKYGRLAGTPTFRDILEKMPQNDQLVILAIQMNEQINKFAGEHAEALR